MRILAVVVGDPNQAVVIDNPDVPRTASVQDITVTVEHDDGTRGVYLVRNRSELLNEIARYEQWASELDSLQAMVDNQ